MNNDVAGWAATLWLLDGDGVEGDALTFFTQQLGASETLRLISFLRPERRRQFILGRILLRFAVSDLTRLPVDSIGIVERPGNAPRLVLPDANLLTSNFSLSHSRNWVACLVSCGASLGLDIEVNDAARDIDSMGEVLFSGSEHLRLLALSRAERVASFYRLWCEREALHKLLCNLGRGSDSPGLLSFDAPEFERFGWHCSVRPFPGLSIVAVSDRRLCTIEEKVLTGISRADWLACARQSC